MAAFQEAEAVNDRQLLRTRVGRAFFEPAERSRAGAAEHDAAIPGLPQNHVDPLGLPDGLLVQRVAAGRDDAVDREQDLFPRFLLAAALDEAILRQGLDVERRAGSEPLDDAGSGCRRTPSADREVSAASCR